MSACNRARVIGSKTVIGKLGRLQAQLAQHVAGLADRLRRAEVVGLAPHGREHRRHARVGRRRRTAAVPRSARTRSTPTVWIAAATQPTSLTSAASRCGSGPVSPGRLSSR